MGNFRIELEAVGDHGCNREAKVGEEVIGCGRMGCPDCEARRIVADALLHRPIGSFVSARLVHWPGSPQEVIDVFELAPPYEGAPDYTPRRLKITRRGRAFLGNEEKAT